MVVLALGAIGGAAIAAAPSYDVDIGRGPTNVAYQGDFWRPVFVNVRLWLRILIRAGPESMSAVITRGFMSPCSTPTV